MNLRGGDGLQNKIEIPGLFGGASEERIHFPEPVDIGSIVDGAGAGEGQQ